MTVPHVHVIFLSERLSIISQRDADIPRPVNTSTSHLNLSRTSGEKRGHPCVQGDFGESAFRVISHRREAPRRYLRRLRSKSLSSIGRYFLFRVVRFVDDTLSTFPLDCRRICMRGYRPVIPSPFFSSHRLPSDSCLLVDVPSFCLSSLRNEE